MYISSANSAQYQQTAAILASSSGGGDPLIDALLNVPIKGAIGSVTGTAALSNLIKEVDTLLAEQGYDKNTQNAFNSYISAAAKKLNSGSNINITV